MYLLEGNMGVGKSTFLKKVQELCPEITIIQEPVNVWTSQTYGQSLLENFYHDPSRWAYTLETLAMMTRFQDHLKEQRNPYPYRIMERSIYSGHYCFALNGYENKFFTSLEWEVYQAWVNFLIHDKCQPPRGFIYLKASPEVCFERVHKRNRLSEKELDFSYMNQIHHKHEHFLVEKQGIPNSIKKVPVLVLDCNRDFQNDNQLFETYIDQIREFFKKTSTQPIMPAMLSNNELLR